ncbi:N-acetyllactosaminide beta-1,3-N-acetylglucosaminyltransferase 4 [Hydra vulgaris]|uniref:N-acetyllactosaminide beta-1,3-N-acetylglucosaminyltransferase 4 n=1 Tax=Hydra vulgaris TaxID=6087 RepID=UPI000640D56D|nr:N-acetyllactosaminide beta-1,3-N-acetylglucosaminyltransferase 4 [Hydra vulgaris]XP_047133858.1 N-acetyllactosaminide beta-1,3-N-acetylglucosaminyltransferase 4 [Hydra vulgaris]XP_047133862.1 N-acetyllactosaminide beta-1,3-N-acetylglucosaminyltransferase 4 [Hydra vulgaris]XP_047133865.1 N-acetyllactosaminide beta-1,3-N-acetylglucosaminyltransferase 4 [Hydra vulgaris]XP_047133868.1 N-acetyllactosaminide beta-1,3-N-acetylglucosaminyltransferase 4 [Hydra vulgaris]XP_047133876.1 N-acetyllactosa
MDLRKNSFSTLRKTKMICIFMTAIAGLTLFLTNAEDVFRTNTDKEYKNLTMLSIATQYRLYLNGSKVLENTTNKENKALEKVVLDFVEKNSSIVYTTVFLISSRVNHTERRNLIRESWGNSSYWNTTETYLIVFVVGIVTENRIMNKTLAEAKVTKDILYLNVTEDFYLLAEKVIIGLTWAKKNLKFKAVLKGDDDAFMNIDNILEFINRNNVINGYFGNKLTNLQVLRTGRYMVTKEEWNPDFFYPYCSGGGFLLTNSSVYKMIEIFDLQKKFRIDDAYIGEVAFQAGITVDGVNGFYMFNYGCEYRNDILVSHPSTDVGCNTFLLKRHLIDKRKIPRDLKLESTRCYRDVLDC